MNLKMKQLKKEKRNTEAKRVQQYFLQYSTTFQLWTFKSSLKFFLQNNSALSSGGFTEDWYSTADSNHTGNNVEDI